MVIYNCEICKKIFDHKSDYIKHTKRKTPCKGNQSNNQSNSQIVPKRENVAPKIAIYCPIESNNPNMIQCKFCGK